MRPCVCVNLSIVASLLAGQVDGPGESISAALPVASPPTLRHTCVTSAGRQDSSHNGHPWPNAAADVNACTQPLRSPHVCVAEGALTDVQRLKVSLSDLVDVLQF